MNGLDDLLDESPVLEENETIDRTKVANKFPTLNVPYRIAIIGEAPGRDEAAFKQPFVGMSGKLLNGILTKQGIVREGVFIGNICQIRPPNNDISRFSFNGSEIQEGLEQLKSDLEKFQPNICILLGKTALFAAKGELSIGDWRGSLFIGTQGCFLGRKCIASYHPAACLRNYEWSPLLMFDIAKAKQESTFPDLSLPQRQFDINLTKDEIIQTLIALRTSKTKIALDIEGGINSWSCISIASTACDCLIIPLTKTSGDSYWSVDDESDIIHELANLLADESVPKVLQNSLYDRFVLQYSYDIIVRGTVDDTMLKSWEKYCELEKGLGFLCSLYTREPFYKADRKHPDQERFWRYCCMDSAVTLEISNCLDKMLDAPSTSHYQFNISLLNIFLYMELKGIKYDTKKAKARLAEVNGFIFRAQFELDRLAGVGIKDGELNELIKIKVQEVLCYKKDPSRPKKDNEEAYERCLQILAQPSLSPQDIGELNVLLDLSMNVKSSRYKTFLYETLKLPKQTKKDKKTGRVALCTDNDALLKIQKKSPHRAVELGIQIMELRTRSQMLSIHADSDGRIRCGYNAVGTVTGRISCYTSPTGSGYNLQTIPDDYKSLPIGNPLRQGMRDLFLADPGYYMFQCDLKGSDGWTIGAHLALNGDSTMLDDLRFGIKPASRVCYMLRHGNGSLGNKSRPEIKELLKEIHKEDWDYFACKIGIWGLCYTMGPDLLSGQIAEESYGQVNLTRKQVEDFRNAVFSAYNIGIWHRASQRYIDRSGCPEIKTSFGFTRRFFGNKQRILGEYLAHEPQAVTTYATNRAALNLWNDSHNRTLQPDGRTTLRIQPLHQVHDAVIGQFRIEDTSWAIQRIATYFNNPIVIAGIPITIPYDGSYGESWGTLNKPLSL